MVHFILETCHCWPVPLTSFCLIDPGKQKSTILGQGLWVLINLATSTMRNLKTLNLVSMLFFYTWFCLLPLFILSQMVNYHGRSDYILYRTDTIHWCLFIACLIALCLEHIITHEGFYRKTQVGWICREGSLQCISSTARMAWLVALHNWSHRRWGNTSSLFSLITYAYKKCNQQKKLTKEMYCFAASDAKTKEIWGWTQAKFLWRGRWAHLPFQRARS